jgi:hypothetical protein
LNEQSPHVHQPARRRGGGVALAARAQQANPMRRIGILIALAESDTVGQGYVGAFREGLQKLGWMEGRTFRIARGTK